VARRRLSAALRLIVPKMVVAEDSIALPCFWAADEDMRESIECTYQNLLGDDQHTAITHTSVTALTVSGTGISGGIYLVWITHSYPLNI
jgi:hypothetical protein